MQIVIDIDEKDFEIMKHNIAVDNPLCPLSQKEMVFKVANGTPLPKGHGVLKDVEPIYDKLIRSYRADERDYSNRGKDYRVGLSNAIDLLSDAPTIIEADKEKLVELQTESKAKNERGE